MSRRARGERFRRWAWETALLVLGLLVAVAHAAPAADAPAAEWRAGVAAIAITPGQPMWLAGYAARDKPSEGKVHDLRAKALALEDARGTRLVIVTMDLLYIHRELRDWLEAEVGRGFRLPPEGLLLNASHTHCGPKVGEKGSVLWGVPPEYARRSQVYLEELQRKLVHLIGEAIGNLEPARLAYSHARAGFAMNRRLPTERGYVNHPYPDGPVDHDVPVLRIDGPDGAMRAVLFGYACHATTLSFYRFCGDYPGFAKRYLEEAHPGATALYLSGCGGDQNPYPRHGPKGLEYCMQHGRTLANAVEAALLARSRPVRGPLRLDLDEVTLAFAEPPTRRQLEEQAKSPNTYVRRHAEVLLKQLDERGEIRKTYPYLVQVAQFGGDLTLVALSGEVVVDYALVLKHRLAGPAVWVAGYSNDVFGYLPSLRVLKEGGYEAADSMRYTPLPGPFAPSVEDLVVKKVCDTVRRVRGR